MSFLNPLNALDIIRTMTEFVVTGSDQILKIPVYVNV